MKKYWFLQLKRYGKVFPAVLGAALVLLVCVGVLLAGFANANENDARTTRLKVAISGDTKNEMLQIGLTALQTFDDTRFAMELVEMSEEEAKEKLQIGQVSAVIIFPPNFIERALYGDVDQIVFITTPGTQNIVSLLKDEITKVIADIALACEKGNYALDRVMDIYTHGASSGKYMEDLSLQYVQLILTRGQVYSLKELGFSEGLDIGQYYVCSLLVFLLMLFGLCFITVGIKGDHALSGLLAARGMGVVRQVWWEYLAYLTAFCALIVAVAAVAALAMGGNESVRQLMPAGLVLRLAPVILMLAAFQGMLFEFSAEPVSGVLLQLLSCLGLCYVCGCFYPVYALPLAMQTLSGVLPVGVAREFLACAYTGKSGLLPLAGILAFTGLFFFMTVLTRRIKMRALGR